jgi:hypothetical protein
MKEVIDSIIHAGQLINLACIDFVLKGDELKLTFLPLGQHPVSFMKATFPDDTVIFDAAQNGLTFVSKDTSNSTRYGIEIKYTFKGIYKKEFDTYDQVNHEEELEEVLDAVI